MGEATSLAQGKESYQKSNDSGLESSAGQLGELTLLIPQDSSDSVSNLKLQMVGLLSCMVKSNS